MRSTRRRPTMNWVAGLFAFSLMACSPKTESVEGGTPDLAMQSRDMGMCPLDTMNLLQNPGFENPSVEPDGNGKANNTGSPPSTIPGKWDGCCSQAGGGTTWTVSVGTPRCGLRSLMVSSQNATANVLNQTFQAQSMVGKTLVASAYVFVPQAGAGAKLAIDVWDLTANKVIATSPTVTANTPDWQPLSVSVPVPSGGIIQLRINSSGTCTAYVDDPSVRIQ